MSKYDDIYDYATRILIEQQIEIEKQQAKIQEEYNKRIMLEEEKKKQTEEYDRKELKRKLKDPNISFRDKIELATFPDYVKAAARSELKRLESFPQGSNDAGSAQRYLEWLLSISWNDYSKEILNINRSREILDAKHYGLQKIKQRIIEFIAVRCLNPKKAGPVLCLYGPPGVGKTSIGSCIAESLNRKFIRVSLAGVHDEVGIRGHSRGYASSFPGKIIRAVRDAGTMNPVIMLDELDKIRGDAASSLLEVLDPSQNSEFVDHYLGIPFDLSQVIFIATANNLTTISAPLLDRLEILELKGYTNDEALNIAKNHLLPKQIKEHGFGQTNIDIRISDEVLIELRRNYTNNEPGVRLLEKRICEILRKIAVTFVEKPFQGELSITLENFKNYLNL
jgi:ATP-dependent Lon protease